MKSHINKSSISAKPSTLPTWIIRQFLLNPTCIPSSIPNQGIDWTHTDFLLYLHRPIAGAQPPRALATLSARLAAPWGPKFMLNSSHPQGCTTWALFTIPIFLYCSVLSPPRSKKKKTKTRIYLRLQLPEVDRWSNGSGGWQLWVLRIPVASPSGPDEMGLSASLT